MEQNKQESKTNIAILEKEDKKEDKLTAHDIAVQKLNLFSSDTLKDFEFHTSNNQKKEKQQIQEEVKVETKKESESKKEPGLQKYDDLQKEPEIEDADKEVESMEQTLFGEIEEIETANNKELEEEIKSSVKTNNKGYSFRMKLFTGVFCVLIALFGGWIIGNAIQISSTASQIVETQASKNIYEANLGSYLHKIGQLDNWDEEGLMDDSSLVPIEEIIPILPTPLEEPTKYEKESNWFDKICNWFGSIFG